MNLKELNKRIAEEVMELIPCSEWSVFSHGSISTGPEFVKGQCGHENCYPDGHPCDYFAHIAAAWQVVEKVAVDGVAMILTRYDDKGEDDSHCCVFSKEAQGTGGTLEWGGGGWGSTASFAICLAALEAVKSKHESKLRAQCTDSQGNNGGKDSSQNEGQT